MRIYIAGINGMVGSAISREANSQGHDVFGSSSKIIDFTDRSAVFTELLALRPDVLVIAAAKVGGIAANSSRPVDFLTINLQIQVNLLDAAHAANIDKVVFLGSSCIYPKFASQPILESALLTGAFEPTNEPYAIAKIAGIKLVEGYRRQYGHHWISVIPTNLYGPNDNFDLESSHVLPGLIHRIHRAKLQNSSLVEIWGDGTPLREFLHVDDLARAVIFLINQYDDSIAINVGSGQEISIRELAEMITSVIQFNGEIRFNPNRPNGSPRKFLNSSLMATLGWEPKVHLKPGIASTYAWFIENYKGS